MPKSPSTPPAAKEAGARSRRCRQVLRGPALYRGGEMVEWGHCGGSPAMATLRPLVHCRDFTARPASRVRRNHRPVHTRKSKTIFLRARRVEPLATSHFYAAASFLLATASASAILGISRPQPSAASSTCLPRGRADALPNVSVTSRHSRPGSGRLGCLPGAWRAIPPRCRRSSWCSSVGRRRCASPGQRSKPSSATASAMTSSGASASQRCLVRGGGVDVFHRWYAL